MNLDELDALVVDADPALNVPIPSGSSAEARWRYTQLIGNPLAPTHRRRRGLRNAGLVATAAAALVLVLVNVIPGSSGPKSAAAAVLEQAAAVAGQQTFQLAPGQYLYTETQSTYQVTLYDTRGSSQVRGPTAQFNETDQAWTNAGGAGSVLATDSTVQFPSAADEAAWNADPNGPSLLQQMALQIDASGGQAITQKPPLDVSDLPTDPSALAAVIANGELHTNIDLIGAGPNATFERTATLLLGPTSGMTPALASALFQVLADQPGVQLLGTVADHEGQTGQAVALATPNGTPDGFDVSKVIVDPTTGSLLEADFALPASTLPPSGAGSCVIPAAGSNEPPSCHSGSVDAILAPAWTDVVVTGVVDSDTATLPPTGNGPITAALVPGAPTGLTGTPENGQVLLSWTAPTNTGATPVTDYVVIEYISGRSTPATGPSGRFDTHSTATSYSWTLGGDQLGATFTVQAVNAEGYGPASSSVTVTP